MTDGKKSEGKEIVDILDIRGRGSDARSWFQRYISDLTKASAAKQVTVGGITGWVSGYVFTKIGKIAAVSIGGSLLLVQIANHQGYIHVNWSKVNRHMEQAKKELEREAQRTLPRLANEMQRFIEDNAILATGFGVGFLLGVASS